MQWLLSCKPAIKEQQLLSIQLTDSLQNFLQNGDVVLRAGRDEVSKLFKLANTKDQQFSHCGVALFEDNKWVVYHLIATSNNPKGAIIKEPFASFLKPENNSDGAIIRYPFDSIQRLDFCNAIKKHYAHKIKFDHSFDLKNDDKMYCSELIYKSLLQATKDRRLIKPTISKMGTEYIAIDDLYAQPTTKIIGKIAY